MFEKLRKKKRFSDKQIIDTLTSNHALENDALRFLYDEVKPQLKQFITSNTGSLIDAEDIIQDAIIVFYEKIKQNKLELHSNVIGYIYKTGKYMWYDRLRKNNRQVYLDDDNNWTKLGLDEFDIELFHIDETAFVNELLDKISLSCQTVLKQSVFEKIPMSEIAKVNGFKNEQIARNKKYRCLKDLRKIITDSNRYKSILKELIYG